MDQLQISLGLSDTSRRYVHILRVSRLTADIMEVKELLGHRHVTTTQIYDKRRRAAREGASHKMPL